MEELSKGSFGRALNTNGVRIEELLTRPVVFELQGFGDDQKRFFCLFFLQAILLLRKNGSSAREQLQHVLIFDEGHNVFPRERPSEVSVPARLAREVREYGEAIIAATQQADVSESLIANSGFKFILRCDYPRDVTFASQLLQVKPEWLPKLPLGTGIARLPVRFYSPFLFTFSVQPIKNTTVPDAVVQEAWARHCTAAPITRPAEPATANDRERTLLQDVAAHPTSKITARYERLGWNYKIGNSIKDSAIAKGLARFDAVSTPTGHVKILSLTESARDLLERAGITVQRLRHGGAEHWKFTIAEHLRSQGFIVTEEAPIGGGKTIDLLATREAQQIAIEVETGRSDIIANTLKCAAIDGDVVFVFTDPAVQAIYAPQIVALLPDARVISTRDLSKLV